MWQTNVFNDPRVGAWYRRVQGRPSWVWQTAITAAVLVVVLPLVLLTLAAVVVAAGVFVILSLVAGGIAFVQRMLGGGRSPSEDGLFSRQPDDGRRNVRVVDRGY